jgi:LmbE family N-acetylglucosaminyl deacetylase
MAKIIFFQAHPDDLEAYCSQLLHHLSVENKDKHQIRIASMTRGEFGLFRYKAEAFKGERLGRVRTYELYRAQEYYGIQRNQIDFFDIWDGSVKFSRKIISRVVEYLNKHKPDILFAPEAIWTFYTHHDHINTGRILYYIIDKNLIEKTPKLFYYSPIHPNFKFPFNEPGYKFKEKVTSCHMSQKALFDQLGGPMKLWLRFNARKYEKWKYAEPYRRVYFGKDSHLNNEPSLFVKFISRMMFSTPLFSGNLKLYTIDEEKIKKQSAKK